MQDAEASLDGLDVGAVETAVLWGYGGGRAELEGCGYPRGAPWWGRGTPGSTVGSPSRDLKYKQQQQVSNRAIFLNCITGIFLHAFNFCSFPASYDSAKITSFK